MRVRVHAGPESVKSPRLTIMDMIERVVDGLHDLKIDDKVHHVMIYRDGQVRDARVSFEEVVQMPDGRTQRAYGLIFSEVSAET